VNKVKIICQPGDLVCEGTLTVLPAHLTYGVRADEGVQFLAQQIRAVQAKIKARNEGRLAREAVLEPVKEALKAIKITA
jgi:cutinase